MAKVREIRAPCDWASLLRGCQSGDEAAWARLHQTFTPLVRAEIRRWEFDREILEDLCQEVFLKFVRSVGNIRRPEAIPSILKKITATIIVDRVRKLRTEKRGEGARIASLDEMREKRGDSFESAVTPRQNSSSEPEEDLTVMLEVLERFDPVKRELIILRFVEKRSYREIEALTGVRSGTLAVRIFRHLAELKRMIISRLECNVLPTVASLDGESP